ncbi:hypothetical protein EIP86_001886 [Pleurotus ostreatoroseus]|nr:hypothetical protein EIP86_001886 [Pleurotus ostreatoroseus]
MQSEECSHIGLNANLFCRCCHAGGPQEYKRSDAGFAALMKVGRPRQVQETRDAILAQLCLATQAGGEKLVKESMTATGVKDSLANSIIQRLIAMGKALRRSTPTRKALSKEIVNQILSAELEKFPEGARMNPLLSMPGVDVHKDTSMEPLHTHLLGGVKYFWAQTVWILEKEKKFHIFQARLNSISRAGLNIPNIMADYMCRYRGGLIGKHFKTISQIMVFAIAGLVSDDLCKAWLAIGRLTVLLWTTGIVDVETQSHTWVQAGKEVLMHLNAHPVDARLLGVSSSQSSPPGTITFPPLAKGQDLMSLALRWDETQTSKCLPRTSECKRYSCRFWRMGQAVITKNGDSAKCGNEVLIRISQRSETRMDSQDHETSEKLVFASVIEILSPNITQERQQVSQTRHVVQHEDSTRYIVNMSALHNHCEIRRALPSHLINLPTFFADREQLHRTAAATLRDQKLQKKLAKEANARKQAEAARQSASLVTLIVDETGVPEEHDDSDILDEERYGLADLVDDGKE